MQSMLWHSMFSISKNIRHNSNNAIHVTHMEGHENCANGSLKASIQDDYSYSI